MVWSAWLVTMRNGAQTRTTQARQGINRAAQQIQRPVPNQTKRAASTHAAKEASQNNMTMDEYEFLVLDVSLGRL